jgi:hypothetical protein
MPNDSVLDEAEYGLAEAAVLSERWLSAATLPDILARPSVLTASSEQRATPPWRVIIRKERGLWRVVEADIPRSSVLRRSIETITDLLNLPLGWNSYSARPIAPQIADKAIRLIAELEPQTPTPDIVPRVQGGLQLEWHTDKFDIEVYIDSPENVTFFAQQLDSGETFEGPVAGHETVFRAWVNRISGK